MCPPERLQLVESRIHYVLFHIVGSHAPGPESRHGMKRRPSSDWKNLTNEHSGPDLVHDALQTGGSNQPRHHPLALQVQIFQIPSNSTTQHLLQLALPGFDCLLETEACELFNLHRAVTWHSLSRRNGSRWQPSGFLGEHGT